MEHGAGCAQNGDEKLLMWTGVLRRARPWRVAWEGTEGCAGWHLNLEKEEASAGSSLSGVKLVNGEQVARMARAGYSRHASPRARSFPALEVAPLPLCGGGHSKNHY